MKLVNISDCDRELFYKQLGGKDSLITVETAFNMLQSFPIAYDVDNVVEQLEKEIEWYSEHGSNKDFCRGIIGATLRAIDIIKEPIN